MPRAASLATKLLDTYKAGLGQVALTPSSGGAFEVFVDGESVFSKLDTGRFPSEHVVIKDVGSKL